MAVTEVFAIPGLKTSEERAAAAVTWLRACVTSGHVVTSGWNQELQQATAALVTAAQSLHDPETLLQSKEYWWIESPAWSDKYLGLSAAPGVPGEGGAQSWKDLKKPAAGVALRLIRIGTDADAETLAAYCGPTDVYLFDPRTGLWQAGSRDAKQWFSDHMNRNYSKVSAVRFRSYVIARPVPVRFTWFGPPSSRKKVIDGTDMRADIGGPVRLAAAQGAGAAPLDIKFCCLSEHTAAFRNDLPASVKVEAIEDEFGSAGRAVLMYRPDLDDLKLTTQYIIRTSLERQKAAEAEDPEANKRHVVNAKNVWSLYCMWKYGGYHLDTGVIPVQDTTPTMTEP